jgi:hypothetical protein
MPWLGDLYALAEQSVDNWHQDLEIRAFLAKMCHYFNSAPAFLDWTLGVRGFFNAH